MKKQKLFIDEIYNKYKHKMKQNEILIISIKSYIDMLQKLNITHIDDIPENIMYDYELNDDDLVIQKINIKE